MILRMICLWLGAVGRQAIGRHTTAKDGGICGYGETRVLQSIRQLHGVFSFEGQKLGYGATFLFQ